MTKSSFGFTLIELMVVVSIIALLSSVLYLNFSKGSAESRDAERKSDLVILQDALELYRNAEGHYPAGCNGPYVWSGENGSSAPCATGDQYIVGLAPKYIPVLPRDPKQNGVSGYMYAVDAEGMVYKLMAENTVESEVMVPTHQFSRCGNVLSTAADCASVPTSPLGTYPYNTNGTTPSQCNTPSVYNNDYALIGGYANGGVYLGVYRSTERAREYFSDIIRCK